MTYAKTGPIFAITKAAAEGAEGWGGPSDSGLRNGTAGCRSVAADGGLHIRFMEPGRHTGGSNYVFADGHSKWFRFETTINPNKEMSLVKVKVFCMILPSFTPLVLV